MLNKLIKINFNDYFGFERGQRLIKQDQVKGSIPYVSSTKLNNGVDDFIDPPYDIMKKHNNKLTFSNSGSVGYCFYHPYDFVASDHVTVIWPKDGSELNIKRALFLKPIIEAIGNKYNFGREISDDRLSKETIRLPLVNNNIDWHFIDSYMDSLMNNIKFKAIKNKKKSNNIMPLEFNKWREFEYDDVFNIERGESKYLIGMQDGDYPYVSATSANNGISAFVNEFNQTPKKITVNYDGSIGEAFYHNYKFFASEKVAILTLKDKELNEYLAMFLITLLKLEKFRYNYGRKWSIESRMRPTKIKLPINNEGNPDWDFMENYIKTLDYSFYI